LTVSLTKADVFDLNGKPLGKIERPGYGTMSIAGGDQSNKTHRFERGR
jgi:hypothetical protein